MAAAKRDSAPVILVVDDDSGVREVFAEILQDEGHQVVVAPEAATATDVVKRQQIDLALVDIWLKPGIDGIEMIRRWSEAGLISFPIGIISGHAEVASAVQAMRYGALDVLTKPISTKVLLEFVSKALAKHGRPAGGARLADLDLGTAAPLVRLSGQLRKAASAGSPALLVGGPDDGCELFARILHEPGRPWIALRGTEGLAEPAKLLGGASQGTLYLPSIIGLSELQQRGLLQLIHNALGRGLHIVAVAERGSAELVEQGEIGEDLARLLGSNEIVVPVLADCVASLRPLIATTFSVLAREEGLRGEAASEDAIEALADLGGRWSETGLSTLLSVVRVLLGAGAPVTADHVRRLVGGGGEADGGMAGLGSDIFKLPLREARTEFERHYFHKLLEVAGNNYVEAARISGLERSYLYRKVRNLEEEA